jgi:hypothetical protein
MNNKPQMNVNIDIKNTKPITSPEGNQVFSEGVILRKVSRFVTGTSEDGVIPVPVFYDVVTGKVLVVCMKGIQRLRIMAKGYHILKKKKPINTTAICYLKRMSSSST